MKKKCILVLFLSVLYSVSFYEKYQRQYIVILDPSGDAKCTGRRIGDSFERGLSLQCAEKIQEMVERYAPHIKIIITRMPGDIVYDLQNASLSNRLHADLFINLNFYYCQETKPTLFLYQFSYGADFACLQGLAFHTYDQAYRINKMMNDHIAQIFRQVLSDQRYQALFSCAGVYRLPIKSLIGVVAPSIALEAGLKNKEAWMLYIEPFVQAILEALE